LDGENPFLKSVKAFDASIDRMLSGRKIHCPDPEAREYQSSGTSKNLTNLSSPTHRYSTPPLGPDEFIVEICLSDIESACNARRGGCNSIEVCTDRSQGGVTPSLGLVDEILRRFKGDLAVNVLIRPRPGNFCYTDNEFEVILRDVIQFVKIGVGGVVVGILTQDGAVDKTRMRRIRALTQGLTLTFHRAFDVCKDARQALRDIIEIGCDRLLTSGGCSSAYEGREALRDIVDVIESTEYCRLKVIAAAGINHKNATSIIENSKVHGVHAGSSVCTVNQSKEAVSKPTDEITPVCNAILDNIIDIISSDDAEHLPFPRLLPSLSDSISSLSSNWVRLSKSSTLVDNDDLNSSKSRQLQFEPIDFSETRGVVTMGINKGDDSYEVADCEKVSQLCFAVDLLTKKSIMEEDGW
jgi:copper homeostasis protein